MIDLNQFGRKAPKSFSDPIADFTAAMGKAGLTIPANITANGKIQRFSLNGKNDKAGWYVLTLESDFAYGAYGDWRSGETHKWCSESENKLTPDQAAKRKASEEALKKQQEDNHHAAAMECRKVWEGAKPAPADFPYLAKKGVQPHDIRIHDGYLIIPMRDNMGDIHSLQRIWPDGFKAHWPGGDPKGHYYTIPGKPREFYLCEGYATGASIHEATGGTVVIAFNAGNLMAVAANIKKKYPTAAVTVCADNDQWKPEVGNTGMDKAHAVGKKYGWKVVHPEFTKTESKPTDFNDLASLEGIGVVRLQIQGEAGVIDPWDSQIRTLKNAYALREPLKFVVSGLITLPSLSILYGAPGTLKSMLLAEMALCVASGQTWLSRPVIQRPVLWIDMDNGKRRSDDRFSAIARAKSLPEETPFYYVSMPQPWLDGSKIEEIDLLCKRIQKLDIGLVCIDNLGLMSMSTEEKTDAMIPIMANLRSLTEDTGAAVTLIHHQRKATTGSARAGDTLRGHSGIEGAIDLALLVTRESADSNTIMVQSTKTRDVDVSSFAAEFRYDHKPGTSELFTAAFVKTEIKDDSSKKQLIMKMISEGFAQTEISAKLKVGRTTIHRYKKEAIEDGLMLENGCLTPTGRAFCES